MMDRLVTDEVYRFLFENSFDAILLTHPSGKIYRANPSACEIFQRTEKEICQLGRTGLVDLNDSRLDAMLKEREEKGRIRTELNFKRKDGSIFPTECTSTIFKDEEGNVWTVIFVRDMSLIKSAESLLRKAQEKVEYYAMYDYLTGILNRRAFMEKFLQELQRSKRKKTSLGLILLDIDCLKKINDTLGHNCGDEVLKNIATHLMQRHRPYDIVGRYGGDEFILCLPDTSAAEVGEIAERLRMDIQCDKSILDENHTSATVSIGLAFHEKNSEEDANDLILRADKNLYIAKLQRNAVYGI